MIRALCLAASLATVATGARADCADTPGPCEIPEGRYHVELPDTDAPSRPAVMFLHGYGGSAEGVLKMRGTVEALTARGYVVIAPEGERRANGNRSWSFYPGRRERDERAFLTAVRADAARRFGVDPERTVLSGFSAGGFMVTYLACEHPGAFAAYAPVSGGFWRPHPQSCAGPVRLFHTHGWTDNVVPLEGRYLGGGRWQQGDIFAGLELFRDANRCADNRPDGFATTGEFLRRRWSRCAEGSALEMALFPGGHGVPKGWAPMMLDWFEALPGA